MQKLKMTTKNLVDDNIEKLAKIFPNCITEVKNGKGETEYGVDFDLLKQELSKELVVAEGDHERYVMNWPDKKKAILTAHSPIAKTLRPCREESVNFDTTKNLYIEGDNLDVIKLLKHTYLGKVKMIYIDPPYNTGKDFVYEDDFAIDTDEYLERSKSVDESGNRLVQNNDSNGRFHTDWLNMIYPRLKIAKDLLTEDGVIFISIDDNEVHNLRKICDEVFGVSNFIASLPTIMNLKGNNDQFAFSGTHEYTLVYAKYKFLLKINMTPLTDEDELNDWEYDETGPFKQGANLKSTGGNAPREKRPNLFFPIYITKENTISLVPTNESFELFPITDGKEMSWRWSKEKITQSLNDIIITKSNATISIYKKQRPNIGDVPTKKPKTLFYKPEYSSGNGTRQCIDLFGGRFFSNPKPLELIIDFVLLGMDNNSLVLDFFSGSSTTAHAVMQLNAEDGGNRRFIMVQLPEITEECSEAYKAGYINICEIGKERIRRAGKKILGEVKGEGLLDVGFRVLKLDSTNMKDVFYAPAEYSQITLDEFAENFKADRTSEDLLFQVMLDMGIMLDAKIEERSIAGKKVFIVNDDALIACFDTDVSAEVVTAIAKLHPLYAVFRDAGLSNDSVGVNFDQIFEANKGESNITTERRIL